MTSSWTLLVNTGSRTCKVTLCDDAGAAQQQWLLEGAGLPASPEPWLQNLQVPVVRTVHRLVQGGDRVAAATRWSTALDSALAPLDSLAPLHNPQARAWARACAGRWPTAGHCFIPDTGFFASLPVPARTLALPASLCDRYGLHRYGFHGLAHSSLWRRLAELDGRAASGRVITLQLGGGCSTTALQGGIPMDTSMGFSPLAGLIMASRPGDLDPGVLLYLLKQGMTLEALEDALVHQSGLLGLSGLSGDMRDLLAAGTPAANHAIDQFCYRIRQYIGSYAATLGGLDGLVFGGGIGEHAAAIRAKVCSGLEFLGVALDGSVNAAATGTGCISRSDSAVTTWVISGNEEAEMFRQAQQLFAGV